MLGSILLTLLISATTAICATLSKVVVTNGDGWAVAQIRAQVSALQNAGFDVILSAPADQRSTFGSRSDKAHPLIKPCQFDSCPADSPAMGYDTNNSRLNYVNAYPVDSVKYGIDTLSPKFFGGPPDFVVSGPSVTLDTGPLVPLSGAVGAASQAALQGFPAIAFSGISASEVSYTTLDTDPASEETMAAHLYSALAVDFVNALISSSERPVLPNATIVNVNFPPTNNCTTIDDFEFVFTRNHNPEDPDATDVETCGTTQLPVAAFVDTDVGCYASVTVLSAVTKADVDAATQKAVLDRISDILVCLPV